MCFRNNQHCIGTVLVSLAQMDNCSNSVSQKGLLFYKLFSRPEICTVHTCTCNTMNISRNDVAVSLYVVSSTSNKLLPESFIVMYIYIHCCNINIQSLYYVENLALG